MVAFKLRWRGITAITSTSSIVLLIMLVAATPAVGQDAFPTRPIKLIVPFAAGGAYDVTARLIGEEMSKDLGSAIVVENRPGAGGNIGAQAAAAAQADGYTLLLGGLPMITSALTSTDMGYDMFKDLTPVCGAMTLDPVLVTSKTTGLDSINALKEKIASGAWVTYGTQGIYTPGHFMAAWFAHIAGRQSRGRALQRGVSLHNGFAVWCVDVCCRNAARLFGTKRPLYILATLSQKRLPQVPDAPTMTDAGMPEYMAVDWRLWAAIYAPAKTPTPVVDRLCTPLAMQLSVQKMRAAFATFAMEPLVDYSPERFSAFQNEQFRKWKVLVDKLDLER